MLGDLKVTINRVDVANSNNFSIMANSLFAEKLQNEVPENFTEFVDNYFQQYPLDELEGQSWDDLFGCVYGWWEFIQKHDLQHGKVKVFNPNLEQHGWLSSHTVIAVLQRDMPFLVDSMRMEINRRNIAIHTIKSTVLAIHRNEKNELVEIHSGSEVKKSELPRETLVYLEVNLHTADEELQELAEALESVLKEVETAVTAYHPLLKLAANMSDGLSLPSKSIGSQSKKTESKETLATSQAFLQWMINGHFTFLGYCEYDLVEKGGHKKLVENIKQRQGVASLLQDKSRTIEFSDELPGADEFYSSSKLLNFAKASKRSRVHRAAYPEYVIVKRFDKDGNVCGEGRFKGLYTADVYNQSPMEIPLIADKLNKVIQRTGLNQGSYDGKMLQLVLETFPRDELFHSTDDELFDVSVKVAQINERHRVRLFMRPEQYGNFVSCMLYVPRDMFNSDIRNKIQNIIGEAVGASEQEFTTYFSESILARVHLVFKVDPFNRKKYDVNDIEKMIINEIRSWDDQLTTALTDVLGEEKGVRYLNEFKDGFSNSYRDSYDARNAVFDIQTAEKLNESDDIAMSFFQPVGATEKSVRFKIFRLGKSIELSDVIPLLENLGLRVIGEHPYKITRQQKDIESTIWLHDFSLEYNLPKVIDVDAAKEYFQEAFAAIWSHQADSDEFNRLVLGANLTWREVAVLRTYASYMKQTIFNFSQSYIANTLAQHLEITRNLVALFKEKFDPSFQNMGSDKATAQLRDSILQSLDAVDNLNEDRIIRRYLDLLDGTLRTNFFQPDEAGKPKSYISIKFSPRDIPDIPEPRPLYEIFVYSPRIEGVHLRGSAVARGGLRWSDRLEDYRTEVLGLVKAQQVKNAVIVPGGAKGGFVAKKLLPSFTRDEWFAEGVECYKIFISGLLDITDNLMDNEILPPKHVVRLDGDDPYLVVAADKGTATFSDIANEISLRYNHWLGDAFASGGSQGYDHKGMGITAKGAWVSVQRHFMEQGVDIQKEDFNVIGIGDMAGDVFGNGMLLSEHICLVAAFNHQHIFIDPTPNSAKSFIERKRLFELPKSSWEDYDQSLISKGGGLFSRSAKSITLTPQIKKVFAIESDSLTPTEFIHELLKSPVDLIWNGGIGTYVKSSKETHAEVGDKANDVLRVNGNELRCKVFGEGGNLGLTQRGRVEFGLSGGAINTDFIDNSAGVDCSDHEVNIKILLNELVANGDLTEKQRNNLLVDMTETVSDLVLANNYQQNLAISIAHEQALSRMGEYRRFITAMQSEGRLNRQLEFLPEDEELVERQMSGQALSRPELSLLVSYSKVMLKEGLVSDDIANDDYIAKHLDEPFPKVLIKKYRKPISDHRLRQEIIATQLANDMVNTMGFTFYQRLAESTGANVSQVAKAYVAARDIYQLTEFKNKIQQLDFKISSELQFELLLNMVRRVRRATRWFLRNRRSELNTESEISLFSPVLNEITEGLPDVLRGTAKEEWQQEHKRLSDLGLPDDVIATVAMPSNLYSGLGMIEAAKQSECSAIKAAQAYYVLGDKISLHWFANEISDVKVESYWQAMAREAYMDDLESQIRMLAVSIIRLAGDSLTIDEMVERWMKQHSVLVNRWRLMVAELQAAPGTDFAMFSVALRELLDLVQATQHCKKLDD